MALNSAENLNCSLTRLLEDVSSSEGDQINCRSTGAMLCLLGRFNRIKRVPDYRGLEKLMELLAEQKHDGLLTNIRSCCAQCSLEPECPVGKIILKK